MGNLFASMGLGGTVAAAIGWTRANVLIPATAEQLGVVAVLVLAFLAYARPLRRALAARVQGVGGPAVQHILVPLAACAPWLVLLLTLWFAVLGFGHHHLATGVLRLAESLALAWVVITLISRLVRDESLARFLAILAFALVALNLAGLLNSVLGLLNSMAITVGTLRISVLLVIKGGLLLALFLWVAGTVARLVEARVHRLRELTPAMQVLVSKLVRFGLLLLAVVLALGAVGIDLTAFAVFSGAIGVGVGFGLQKVVSNLVSGVILLLDRSIKPGDVIEIDGDYGWITSLNARYVSVATRDGKELLIPNEDLITDKVTSWSFSNELIRLHVAVGIGYGSDVHLAMRLAIQAAHDVNRSLEEPRPICLLTGFGDSSVNLELRFWIRDPRNGTANARSEVMLRIWDLYHEHGIEFPFPQRDLNLRNPEALAEALRAPRPSPGQASERPARAAG
jgi:small-conductance mechanosensitive channel